MAATIALSRPTRRKWSSDLYSQILDAGLLGPEDKLEYLAGEIVYKLDYYPFAAFAFRATGVPPRYLWTPGKINDLRRLGILQPEESVECVDDEEAPAMSQHAPHPTSILLIADVLRRLLGPDAQIREEKPLHLPDGSEPEPDVVYVPGKPRDYREAHPTAAHLVIEVAESSLELDRTYKSSMYARAGIQDFWIVNLVDYQIEIFRQPVEDQNFQCGYRYERVEVVRAGGFVTPLVRSDLKIAVSDLLP